MEGFLEEGTSKIRSEANQWGRHSSQGEQHRQRPKGKTECGEHAG